MIKEPTLRQSIEFAVTTEELGASFYSRLADMFSDQQEISKLFETLSQDELSHQRQFSDLLSSLSEEEETTARDEDQILYLRAMSSSQFFSSQSGPFKDVDKIRNRNEALKKAFNLEKATLSYYQAVKDVLGEHPVLESVINAEKKHLVNVVKALISEGELRSLDNNW